MVWPVGWLLASSAGAVPPEKVKAPLKVLGSTSWTKISSDWAPSFQVWRLWDQRKSSSTSRLRSRSLRFCAELPPPVKNPATCRPGALESGVSAVSFQVKAAWVSCSSAGPMVWVLVARRSYSLTVLS